MHESLMMLEFMKEKSQQEANKIKKRIK